MGVWWWWWLAFPFSSKGAMLCVVAAEGKRKEAGTCRARRLVLWAAGVVVWGRGVAGQVIRVSRVCRERSPGFWWELLRWWSRRDSFVCRPVFPRSGRFCRGDATPAFSPSVPVSTARVEHGIPPTCKEGTCWLCSAGWSSGLTRHMDSAVGGVTTGGKAPPFQGDQGRPVSPARPVCRPLRAAIPRRRPMCMCC